MNNTVTRYQYSLQRQIRFVATYTVEHPDTQVERAHLSIDGKLLFLTQRNISYTLSILNVDSLQCLPKLTKEILSMMKDPRTVSSGSYSDAFIVATQLEEESISNRV